MKIPAFFAIGALVLGCGPTVYIPGEGDGSGLEPGSGGAAAITKTGAGAGTTGSDPNCDTTCSGKGTTSCSCKKTCETTSSKIICEEAEDVQGNVKLTCTCIFGVDNFAGICFEDEPANSCDWHVGCCHKYSQSTN